MIFSNYKNEPYVLLVKDDSQLPENEWRITSRLLNYPEELHTTAAAMLFELTNLKNLSTELLDVSVGNSDTNGQTICNTMLLDSGYQEDLVVTKKAKLYRLDKEKYSREYCQLINFVRSGERHLPFVQNHCMTRNLPIFH